MSTHRGAAGAVSALPFSSSLPGKPLGSWSLICEVLGKIASGPGDIAQGGKALALEAQDQSLISRTHLL